MTSNLEFYRARRRYALGLMYAAAALVGIGLGNGLRLEWTDEPIWSIAWILSVALPAFLWLRARGTARHWEDQIDIELGAVI